MQQEKLLVNTVHLKDIDEQAGTLSSEGRAAASTLLDTVAGHIPLRT